jgi:hypothetical protein
MKRGDDSKISLTEIMLKVVEEGKEFRQIEGKIKQKK